ncbi:MAG: PspC domain-containing protein [Intrasporangium sp.]|uniref:PspC domain-containing protein n=1 Tax=Intrasporangium sp. TaxID=1925024 RepID=UPI002648C37B|nr:PspC domain-containing protein [Intrasporangium sp.]MDN5796496.1 PspC domain-containing protein [Intrasporangium sp.]
MTSNPAPNPNLDSTGAAEHRPPSSPSTDRFFAWLRRQPVRRDTTDRWFGGVCSAVATQLRVSPTAVRIGTVVLALFAGFGVLAYLTAWLLLPSREGRILAEDALRTGRGGPVVLLAFVSFAILTGLLGLPALVSVLVVLAGIWLLSPSRRARIGLRHHAS